MSLQEQGQGQSTFWRKYCLRIRDREERVAHRKKLFAITITAVIVGAILQYTQQDKWMPAVQDDKLSVDPTIDNTPDFSVPEETEEEKRREGADHRNAKI